MLLCGGGEDLDGLALGGGDVIRFARYIIDSLSVYGKLEMTVERVEAFLEGVQWELTRSQVRLGRNDAEETHRKDDKIWLWVEATVSSDGSGNHLTGMAEVC